MTIFISYRREDSSHFAGRLYDSIREGVPNADVFMDVTSISFGEDFRDVLNDRLKSCEAALVIIGPKWLEPVGDTGKAKLDDPDDYIRLEIETALDRKIPLIPVLVDGAQMPGETQIPEKLRGLRRRQFVRIDHDNYTPVVRHLVSQLSRLVQTAPGLHAERPPPPESGPRRLAEVAPPQSEVPTNPARTAKRKRRAVVVGASALVLGFVIHLLTAIVKSGPDVVLPWIVIVGGLAIAVFVWRRA